jgi:hypothetical protein
MYTLVSHQEANTIEQVLLLTSEHPPKCYCCKPQPRRMNWATACRLMYQNLCESLSITRTVPWALSPSLSAEALPRYTPDTSADSNSFSARPQEQAPSSFRDLRQTTGTAFRADTNDASHCSTASLPLIVFGIEKSHGFHTIENIEVQAQFDDPSFFWELKRKHQNHRGWFQQWFSPYRFRYCRFVQVI